MIMVKWFILSLDSDHNLMTKSEKACKYSNNLRHIEFQYASYVLSVGTEFADVVEVAHIETAISATCQSHRGHQAAVLCCAITALAVQTSLLPIAQHCDHFSWSLFQVNVCAISFVQNA